MFLELSLAPSTGAKKTLCALVGRCSPKSVGPRDDDADDQSLPYKLWMKKNSYPMGNAKCHVPHLTEVDPPPESLTATK